MLTNKHKFFSETKGGEKLVEIFSPKFLSWDKLVWHSYSKDNRMKRFKNLHSSGSWCPTLTPTCIAIYSMPSFNLYSNRVLNVLCDLVVNKNLDVIIQTSLLDGKWSSSRQPPPEVNLIRAQKSAIMEWQTRFMFLTKYNRFETRELNI